MREKSAKTEKREGSACYKRSWNTSAKRETQIKVLRATFSGDRVRSKNRGT